MLNHHSKEMTEECISKGHCESEEGFGGPVFEPRLYIQRYYFVQQQLIRHRASSVVDFGSAECKISRFLVRVPTLEQIAMVDIDHALLKANRHVIRPQAYDYLDRRERPLGLRILCGSLTEMDKTVGEFDAITMVEVIEHLHEDVLAAACDNLFGRLQPRIVILTTPNSEFNVLFPGFSGFRHYDHKFEWTRQEFQEWCTSITDQYPYTVEYEGIGDPPADRADVGHCSQAAIFVRKSGIPKDDKASCVTDTYQLVAESTFPHKKTSDLTEEEAILMELNYLLRQHSLATNRNHNHSETETNQYDNQSYSNFHDTFEEISGSRQTENIGTKCNTLQSELESSQCEALTQIGSKQNVTVQKSTCCNDLLSFDDSLEYQCKPCLVQSGHSGGEKFEDCQCSYKSDSYDSANKTDIGLSKSGVEERDKSTVNQSTINTKHIDEYKEDFGTQCTHSAEHVTLGSKIDSDIKAHKALMSESILEPDSEKKSSNNVDSDTVQWKEKDSGVEDVDEDDKDEVMVPLLDLLKYKRISSVFDVEQLRSFLQEHNYTLSDDLSCVIYTLETEDMFSDLEEGDEEDLIKIEDDYLSNIEEKSHINNISSIDIETECWD